jgi:ElaB/YqjD/DUF883 family membrane-anchored ribosome-binding protein
MTAESPLDDERALAVLRARAELAGTLDALEYKLNVPRQLRRARRRVNAFADDHPAVAIGVAASALALVVGSIWAGVRILRR